LADDDNLARAESILMLFEITISFAAGLIVGTAYFVGLWFTVRRLTGAGLAPLWLIISAVVRLAFLIAALFWIMDDRWERLLAALAGILVARVVATWTARASDASKANNADRPQTIGVRRCGSRPMSS
jgi:F1F0 ATPase subunit 2